MSKQKKARVAAQASNKSQSHNTTARPVSTYRAKQYQRAALGQALNAAMNGGRQ